ncbi:MAG: TldD/PmbA family protein [Candidatus Aenigmatarchaeota archaeon]
MLDLIEKVLNYIEKLTSYSEVRYENVKSNRFTIKNGVLEATEINKSFGLSIRFLKNGFLGAVYSNDLRFSKIRELINKNLRKVRKEQIGLSKENVYQDEYEVKQKINLEDVSQEEKIKAVIEIENALKNVLQLRYFELYDEIKEKIYVNSEGSKIIAKIPRISFEYILTFLKNGKSEQRSFQFGGSGGWETFQGWNLIENLTNEAKILKKISVAKKLKPGLYDVILSPEIAGIASHESCGHPYEADRILGREAAQAGKSFVTKEMLGERVGSNVVSVADDPTIKNSYGFYLYDDEGIKAKKRILIKNGIINSFLQNRETAFEFKTKSNAAARANAWHSEPIVRMANTFIVPGNYKFEELLESIKNGVYIKSYMEWNIDDKRFNQKYTGLESYLIKNGEIKKLIKRPILEITTPKFWSSIDAVGNDLDFVAGNCGKSDPMQGVPVWFGGPHIRLRKIILR